MLVSVSERAYILIYDEGARGVKQRHWNSWRDYMREWCTREDFRAELDTLLIGKDADFRSYIRNLAEKAVAREGLSNTPIKTCHSHTARWRLIESY
jgi:hypothetical protein